MRRDLCGRGVPRGEISVVDVYHEERYLWYRCLMRRDLCGRGVSLGKISVVEE